MVLFLIPLIYYFSNKSNAPASTPAAAASRNASVKPISNVRNASLKTIADANAATKISASINTNSTTNAFSSSLPLPSPELVKAIPAASSPTPLDPPILVDEPEVVVYKGIIDDVIAELQYVKTEINPQFYPDARINFLAQAALHLKHWPALQKIRRTLGKQELTEKTISDIWEQCCKAFDEVKCKEMRLDSGSDGEDEAEESLDSEEETEDEED